MNTVIIVHEFRTCHSHESAELFNKSEDNVEAEITCRAKVGNIAVCLIWMLFV